MTLTPELVVVAFAAFLFAGVVKGTIGIGLPTITISIVAQVADPRLAVALLFMPALVTNSWQVYRGGQLRRSIALLWPFALTLIGFMFFSAQYAALASVNVLVAGIGCMVVVWTVSGLFQAPLKISDRIDRPVQLIAGTIAGLIGGLTAIWSPPMVMYLQARHRDKNDFVAFTGFLILCGTVPLILGYLRAGLLNAELARGSALMIAPTLIGFTLGERLRQRFNSEQFHRVLLIIFCMMGLNLIRRAVFGAA